MKKWLTSLIIVFLVSGSISISADPVVVVFQNRIQSPSMGFFNSTVPVTIGLYDDEDSEPIWHEYHRAVTFDNGYFRIQMGSVDQETNPLLPAHFYQEDLQIGVQVFDESFFFPMSSIPYAVRVFQAEEVSIATAESMLAGSAMPSATMNSGLVVGGNAFYVRSSIDSIGINVTPSIQAYDIDVGGLLNANNLRVNGVPILQTFSWQDSPLNEENIYFNGESDQSQVTIGSASPVYRENDAGDLEYFRMHVNGGINATDFLRDGSRLSAGLDWQQLGDDLYFKNIGSRVGIRNSEPVETLDVNGGVLIGDTASEDEDVPTGTVMWTGSDYLGYDGEAFRSLIGIRGTGADDRLAYFTAAKQYGSTLLLSYRDGNLGIGEQFPSSRVYVSPDEGDLMRVSSGNHAVLFISEDGRVVLGRAEIPDNAFINIDGFTDPDDETALSVSRVVWNELHDEGVLTQNGLVSDSFDASVVPDLASVSNSDYEAEIIEIIESYRTGRPSEEALLSLGSGLTVEDMKLKVFGEVNADDILMHGLPIRFSVSKGTYFISDRDSLDALEANIFYLKSDVSIGMPETDNLFQIAAPYDLEDDDVVTKDPAITFRFFEDGDDSEGTYTFGVDADKADYLRVEQGAVLGASDPLFVVKDELFGVGLEEPQANLHVSGDLGVVIQGQFDYDHPFEDTVTEGQKLHIETTGTKFFFKGDKAALRVGRVTDESPTGGEDFFSDNIGEHSMAMGYNLVASGNYATALGGTMHEVNGAYSTTMGGDTNVIDGFYSLGLGSYVHVQEHLHGSFVWGDTPYAGTTAEIMETSKENQFLIRASTGVGIGTSVVNAGLGIKAKPVLKSDFLSILPDDTTDLDASVAVFDALVSDGYLDTDGNFLNFMPRFVINDTFFVTPVDFSVVTQDVYSYLETQYRNSETVSRTDLQDLLVLNTTDIGVAQSLWETQEKLDAAFEIWVALVDAGIIKSSGNVFAANPTGFTHENADDDTDLETYLLDKYNSGPDDLVDPSEPISTTELSDFIDDDVYDSAAFAAWTDGEAKVVAADQLYLGLIARDYITKSGAFDSFLPIFDFDDTSFNGQDDVATADVFAVLMSKYDQVIVRGSGVDDARVIEFGNHGNVNFDPSLEVRAPLYMEQGLSIGTTDTPAHISIQSAETDEDDPAIASANYAFAVFGNEDDVTPSFVVNHKGMVGVKIFLDEEENDLYKEEDNVLLRVDGSIIASSFEFATGETLSVKDPVIVFEFEDTTPNIYFLTGNVGIGTLSPNSLLELSNIDGRDPAITFDLLDGEEGVDHYTLGIEQEEDVFRIGSQEFYNGVSSNIVINSDQYVGLFTDSPNYPLHVSGSVIVSGNVVVASQNGLGDFTADVLGVSSLTIDNSTVLQWIIGDESIYSPANGLDVGIGAPPAITGADEGIDIYGTTKVDDITVSNLFYAKSGFQTHYLDVKDGYTQGTLHVEDGDLFMQYGGGEPLNVSNFMSSGRSLSGTGVGWNADDLESMHEVPISWTENANKRSLLISGVHYEPKSPAWLYDTDTESWVYNTYYDHTEPGVIELTGNLSVARSMEDRSLLIDNTVSTGVGLRNYGQYVKGILTYEGYFFDDSDSYTVVSTNIVIDTDVDDDDDAGVIGHSIDLSNRDRTSGATTYLTNGATAYGLRVDVSDVVTQEGGPTSRGYKFPAIFMGDVGIGAMPSRDSDLTDEQNVIEVRGTLTAESFNIAERLLTTTVNAASNSLVVDGDGNVGIGTLEPQSKLDIRGTVLADNMAVTTGIEMSVVNIHSDSFVVNSDGFVGVGTTIPRGNTSQFEIFRSVSEMPDDDIFFQRIVTDFEHGSEIYKNYTAMDIKLSSLSDDNVLGEVVGDGLARGLDVNLTQLNASPDATIVGVQVDMPTSNAAVFMGGLVGIGTSSPDSDFAIEIEGTLRAINSTGDVTFLTDPNGGKFSHLVVTDNIVIGDANEGTMTATRLYIEGDLSFPGLSIEGVSDFNLGLFADNLLTDELLVTRGITLNSELVVETIVSSPVMLIEDKMAIGFSSLTSYDLAVRGGTVVDTANINELVYLGSFSANNDRLNAYTSDGQFGLGTDSPKNAVDVQFPETLTEYIVTDNTTWDALVIQGGNSDMGSSAGISFQHTEDDTPAILAIRSSDTVASGSHLVFITNDEALRIMEDGDVGIGTVSADARLSVVGNVITQADTSVSDTLYVNSLGEVSRPLTIATDVYIPVTLDVTSLFEGDHLQMQSVGSIVTQDSEIGFYVSRSTGELVYSQELVDGTPISGEISKEFAFSGNEIPFIGESYALTADDDLVFLEGTAIDTLKFGTSMNVLNTLTSQNAQSFTSEKVSVLFSDRSLGSDDTFIGVSVVATGSALAINDVVTGIDVDLSALRDESAFVVEGVSTTTEGTKYAALFDGGVVAIVVTDNLFPEVSTAQLYVMSGVSGNAALNVTESLFVTSNGAVGIGGVDAGTQFTVSGSAESELIVLRDSEMVPFFTVQQGVGIGTSPASEGLYVEGVISANNMSAGEAQLDSLVVGDASVFTVSDAGTGIGISNPTAKLHLVRSYDGTDSRRTVQENHILLSTPTNADFNALVMEHSTSGNNSIGAGYTATGIQVNMTDLLVEPEGTVVGLVSRVTGNRISARFFGNVGIGTTTPEYDLQVAGALSGHNYYSLSEAPDLEAQDATFNSLLLNGDAQAQNTMFIDEGHRIYVEHLIFKDHEADFDLEEAVGSQVGLKMNDMFAENGHLMVDYVAVSTEDSRGVSLNIAGDAALRGAVALDSRHIYLDGGMQHDADIRVSANVLITEGALYAGQSLSARSLRLPKISDQTASQEYAMLYVNSDDHLYYAYDNGVEVIEDSLTQTLIGDANTITFFDGDTFNSVSGISYRDSVFEVGTANYVPVLSDGDAAYSLRVGVSSNTLSNRSAYSIEPLFLRRIKGQDSNDGSLDFSALQVSVSGDVALGDSDTLTGLVVDLESLISDSQSENGDVLLDGDKISAVFLGGAVSIVSTESAFDRGVSSANLHIINTTATNLGFKVSGNSVTTLVVTGNGRVGLGTSDAGAGLEISRNAGLMPLFVHKDDVALFTVDTNVLIGNSDSEGDLVVGGSVTANYLSATELSANSIQIGDAGTFRVNSEGQVLMGVETSSAQAEFYRVLSGLDSPFVQQQSQLSIATTQEDSVAGINVSFSEAEENIFAGSNATGIRVRMNELASHPDARIVGVASTANASAIAARLRGGNVGVGTTTPEGALDVKGTIHARNFVTLSDTSPELSLEHATINNLIVLQNAIMPNTTLIVDNESKLIVDELRFSEQNTPVSFMEQIGSLSTLEMDELRASTSVVLATVNIGVLTSNYTQRASFNVEVDAAFYAETTISDTARFTVNNLAADTDVFVYADMFASGMAVNGSMASPLLRLQPTADMGTLPSHPLLYVDAADNELKVGKNDSDVAILSVIQSGEADTIPFFDSDGSMKSSTSHLFWDADSSLSTFTVGDKDQLLGLNDGDALLDITSTMLSDTPQGEYVLQSLSFLFDRRITPSDSEFVGMDVLLTANYDLTPLRTSPLDQAIGFKIDMRGLSENSTTQLPLSADRLISGYKYAALFQGGGVGIVTSGNYQDLGDSALLHVSANTHALAMMIESQDIDGNMYNAIIVTSDGRVSIATEDIFAQLGAPSLSVRGAGDESILFVSENVSLYGQTGALVGVASSGEALLRVDHNTESYNLFVSSLGDVGVYESSPEATLHIGSSGSNIFQVQTASDFNSTDYEDDIQPDTDEVQDITSASGGYSVSQQFSPLRNARLTSVTLAFSKSGTTESPSIQFDIYELGGVTPLYTKTLSPYLPNSGVVVPRVIDIDSALDLSVGTTYEIRLTHTGDNFQVRYSDVGADTGLYFETVSEPTGQLRFALSMTESSEDGLLKVFETVADGSTRIGDFSGGQTASLNAENHIMAGDNSYTASNVPTDYLKGFVGVQNGEMISLGLRDLNLDSEPQDTDALSSIMYSGGRFAISHALNTISEPNLQFSHYDEQPFVGVFTQYPSWNFDVTSLEGQDAFYVGTSPTYNFRVDADGNVKLGQAVNDVLFAISGNILAEGILDSSTIGTRFQTSSFSVINSNGNSSGNMLMDVLVGNFSALSVKDINLTLDEDMRNNEMVGLDIDVDSSVAYNASGAADAGHATGLYINVDDLAVVDPTFVSNNAFKAAATFTSYYGDGDDQVIDVKVGIGTTRAEGPLDVRTMDRGGSETATGIVAAFIASTNPLENLDPLEQGSGLKIEVYESQQYQDDYYGDSSFTPIVPNDAFTPIVFTRTGQTGLVETVDIDLEQSNVIFQELQDQSNPVINSDGTIDLSNDGADMWYTRLENYYGKDLGLYVTSRNVYRVLKQYVDRSVVGFTVHDQDDTGNEYPTLLMATGRTVKAGEHKFGGHVGIGVGDIYAAGLAGSDTYATLFQEALHINGDMRVGITKNAGIEDSTGGEPALYFSGGPKFGTSELLDSDNGDPLLIQRENYDEDRNRLKVSIGESELAADAEFSVGVQDASGDFDKLFTVRAFANEKSDPFDLTPDGVYDPDVTLGMVGIGHNEPVVPLHVKGAVTNENLIQVNAQINETTTSVVDIQDHLAVFENTAYSGDAGTQELNTLALAYSAATIGEDTNFMTFMIQSGLDGYYQSLGAVEAMEVPDEVGVDGAVLAYSSPERDYAEYIEKMNPSEEFQEGDVVGIFAGKVSHKTEGADQIMAVSSTPIVVGNWPGRDKTDGYVLIAFLGQVPVNVKGIVHKGDFIVSSGAEDGTAVAISPSAVDESVIDRIVGRSWEESDDEGVKTVNTLVGFPYEVQSIEIQLAEAKNQVESLKKFNEVLDDELNERYAKRQRQLSILKAQVKELRN